MIRAATDVLLRAGVPAEQAKAMMLKVNKVYPSPTQEDIYQEHLNDPLVSMALGERHKELSFYRTGKREWTDQDAQLIEECLNDLMVRTKKDRALMGQFSMLVLGPRSEGQ